MRSAIIFSCVIFICVSGILSIPAPVVKKDKPKPLLQFDHFAEEHSNDDTQIESSKSTRSAPASPIGQDENDMELLHTLETIQNSVHLPNVNSTTPSSESSVGIGTAGSFAYELDSQIKKLREQAELYQMINDMIKAETMVQNKTATESEDIHSEPDHGHQPEMPLQQENVQHLAPQNQFNQNQNFMAMTTPKSYENDGHFYPQQNQRPHLEPLVDPYSRQYDDGLQHHFGNHNNQHLEGGYDHYQQPQQQQYDTHQQEVQFVPRRTRRQRKFKRNN